MPAPSLRRGISPIWKRALGSASPALRFGFAFAGGFLILLGARIADGCTSGHGISDIGAKADGDLSHGVDFSGGAPTIVASF